MTQPLAESQARDVPPVGAPVEVVAVLRGGTDVTPTPGEGPTPGLAAAVLSDPASGGSPVGVVARGAGDKPTEAPCTCLMCRPRVSG